MIIVQVAGHLGSDPEVRFIPSGQKVTTFRIAANIKRGDKEKTVWWRVTCWGDRFDKRLAYLRKGSAAIVIGDMGIPEIYTDKSGNQQISHEITAEIVSFSPFGKGTKTTADGGALSTETSEAGVSAMEQAPSYKSAGVMPGAGQANFADDDLPF
jgi:single-strand DNA-binding protein